MSKSLASLDFTMTPLMKGRVIDRRIAQDTKGLGYWAAKDAQKQMLAKAKAAVEAAKMK